VARDNQTFTTTIDAAGAATIRIEPVGPAGRHTWTVDQLSLEITRANRTALGRCAVRLDGDLIDHALPWHDVLADPPPVVLRPGHVITVEWTDCTPGDTASVTVFFDDGK
jgi:hypothetical protein